MTRVSGFILNFIGDMPSEEEVTSVTLAQAVCDVGLRFPDARDEIYCQLCKVLTDNPAQGMLMARPVCL